MAAGNRGQYNDTVRLIEHTLRDAIGNIESFLIAAVRAARRVQRSQPRALHPTRHPIAGGTPTPQELLRPERIGTRDFPRCLRKGHV